MLIIQSCHHYCHYHYHNCYLFPLDSVKDISIKQRADEPNQERALSMEPAPTRQMQIEEDFPVCSVACIMLDALNNKVI